MAKRYRKKSKAKRKRARKDPQRVRAGKKAWRAKLRRYGSKAAALAHSFGKRKRWKRGRKARKGHGHRGSAHARRVAAGRRSWEAKVRRYGSKAAAIAATFGRHRHRHAAAQRGHEERKRFASMGWLERIQARRARKAAKKKRAKSIHAGMKGRPVMMSLLSRPQPTGFSPELRARLLAMKAEREARLHGARPLPLPG